MNQHSPEPPPVIVRPADGATAPEAKKPIPRSGLIGALIGIGLLLLNFGKYILVGLKFLKFGAVLQTGLSMLVYAWFYSVSFGWPFAVGFALTILVHEFGHVIAAWAYKVPVSAPMFIPGMGAFIAAKTPAPSVFAEAVIGIGGPVAGYLAGLACWGVFAATSNGLFLALANITFLMNLFNMAPVFPMDGGRVLGAVSKWFLIPGMVLLVTLFATGVVRNPLILIIILLALPQVWQALKGGSLYDAAIPATSSEKAVIGVGYVFMVALLAWSMAMTDSSVRQRAPKPPPIQVASTSI